MAKPYKLKGRRRGSALGLPVKIMGGLRTAFLAGLPYILSLVLAGLLLGGVTAYALGSPTFQLEEVRVLNVGSLTPEQAFSFCDLRPGENLISLDLVNVQQVIGRKHPEFKEVKVRRVLPNRLEVMLKRRTPAAQAHFSRYIQIDRELVVLSGSSPAPFKNLTVIEGAALPRRGLFVGAMIEDAGTKKALKILDAVRQSGILKDHLLSKIDIRDPKNFVLIVDGDVEVRLGDSHFIERLKILDQTIRTIGLDRDRVRYVDLRFDDVVVGPR